jgi:hypothetical protein
LPLSNTSRKIGPTFVVVQYQLKNLSNKVISVGHRHNIYIFVDEFWLKYLGKKTASSQFLIWYGLK